MRGSTSTHKKTTMKFIKKVSGYVNAVQITKATFTEPHPNPEHVVGVLYDPVLEQATMTTNHGVAVAQVGDWIITNSTGESYPCQADIFESTYTAVETEDPVADEFAVVSKKRLDELAHKENKLLALEAAGVDNWDGYAGALEIMKDLEAEG